MRIAILADPLDNQSAGVHIYTRELLRSVLQADTENEYLLIRQKRDPSLAVRQVVVPNINLPIGFASFRLFFIIPLIIRLLKVDAVLEPAHFGPFNLPSRIRRITVIHDLTPILFPNFHRWHSQFLQKLFLGRILKKADLIVSNSKSTSSDLEKVYPVSKGKIATLLLGKEDLYRPVEKKEYLLKKKITQPYFLFVGTIEPRKNLLLLLEAFARFKEKDNEGVQLIIVGGAGWKSEAFLAALEKHPYKSDIIRPGYVEKQFLPELYSFCLAFIYPSFYEGFGFPILEAMTCGASVITSNVSSMPEVGGDAAYYINPHSVESLLHQMRKIAAFTAEEKKDAQVKSIVQSQKFSWERFALEFVKALKLHLMK